MTDLYFPESDTQKRLRRGLVALLTSFTIFAGYNQLEAYLNSRTAVPPVVSQVNVVDASKYFFQGNIGGSYVKFYKQGDVANKLFVIGKGQNIGLTFTDYNGDLVVDGVSAQHSQDFEGFRLGFDITATDLSDEAQQQFDEYLRRILEEKKHQP